MSGSWGGQSQIGRKTRCRLYWPSTNLVPNFSELDAYPWTRTLVSFSGENPAAVNSSARVLLSNLRPSRLITYIFIILQVVFLVFSNGFSERLLMKTESRPFPRKISADNLQWLGYFENFSDSSNKPAFSLGVVWRMKNEIHCVNEAPKLSKSDLRWSVVLKSSKVFLRNVMNDFVGAFQMLCIGYCSLGFVIFDGNAQGQPCAVIRFAKFNIFTLYTISNFNA